MIDEKKTPEPTAPAAPTNRDPVHQMCLFLVKMGRELEIQDRVFKETLAETVQKAFDVGYATGRRDIEKELGLDERAVLIGQPKPPKGGTGAPAAN